MKVWTQKYETDKVLCASSFVISINEVYLLLFVQNQEDDSSLWLKRYFVWLRTALQDAVLLFSFAPEQQSQTQLWVYLNTVSAAGTIAHTSEDENIFN